MTIYRREWRKIILGVRCTVDCSAAEEEEKDDDEEGEG
jgi:hypothetical protein